MVKGKRLYFRLGVFILLAAGALVALAVVLGTGSLLRRNVALETYFNESVQGVEVGSKVLFRGVLVGNITRLTFTYVKYQLDRPPEQRSRYVLVEFNIRPELVGAGAVSQEELVRVIRGEVDKGMRVRQEPQGVTGLSYLELDYVDPASNPPLKFDWTPDNVYVPSARSTVGRIVSGAEQLVQRLSSVDVEGFVTNVNRLAVTLEQKVEELQVERLSNEAAGLLGDLRGVSARMRTILASPAWEEAPKNIGVAAEDVTAAARDAAAAAARIRQLSESQEFRKTLQQFQQTLARIERVVAGRENDIASTLANLRQITDNLRDLSENAKRYPSGVIFGDPPKPDQIKR